jgi:hypothetical protein
MTEHGLVEQELREIMEQTGCDRERAEFIRALGRGETTGDVVALGDSPSELLYRRACDPTSAPSRCNPP